MNLFLERTESPRERAAREAFERATANDPDLPSSLKSKEQKRRERQKAKDEARRKDYEQKERTLAYKRERLAWQKEQSAKKDSLGSGEGSTAQISYKDQDPTAYQKMIGNVGRGVKIAAKAGVEAVKNALEKRREEKAERARKAEYDRRMKKEMGKKLLPPGKQPKNTSTTTSSPNSPSSSPSPRRRLLPSSSISSSGSTTSNQTTRNTSTDSLGRRSRRDPEFKKKQILQRGGSVTEEFSCWREEFLYELGDMRKKKKNNKDSEDYIVDVMKGKNKITIGPTVKEGYLEEKKRDQLANAVLGIAFATNAAQSPEALIRSGHIESPGMQLMSRMMQKRKEADRNLDSGRVSHPARNKKLNKQIKESVDKKELMRAIIKKLVDEKKRKNYLLNYGYIGEESKKDSLKCNKPQRAPKGAKQKYIVKACDGGKEKILRFGFRGMQDFLQHKDEKRRANFKARHRCSEKTDKLTPGWWACNYNW